MGTRDSWRRVAGAAALSVLLGAAGGDAAERLRVSEDGRRLERADGEPFFYLADTAWELFHRLDREEADRYLRDRAAKGFTAVQAVALAELDGLRTPNAYGHLPLVDADPTRPAARDGPRNDYWDHVDHVVRRANELGLVVAMLPTWGDKWNLKWGVGPVVFDEDNARVFGRFLGRRYRDADLIWFLGGDRPIETDTHRAIVEAMAAGLADGDGGTHLRAFHPGGCQGSSDFFHGAAWLDLHARQNGHVVDFRGCYAKTLEDYLRTPARPVIDAEPIYEDHPIAFDAPANGYSLAADTRRTFYWDVFSGACGHAYGHHAIWQMWTPDREPVNGPLMPWEEALDRPGARHACLGRRLMESRPREDRVPDDGLVVAEPVAASVPGGGARRFVATRDRAGRYAMVYAPVSRPLRVRLDAIAGDHARAWWFDPRSGESFDAGVHPASGVRRFVPPTDGETLDWVLVLDAADRGYAAPGSALP